MMYITKNSYTYTVYAVIDNIIHRKVISELYHYGSESISNKIATEMVSSWDGDIKPYWFDWDSYSFCISNDRSDEFFSFARCNNFLFSVEYDILGLEVVYYGDDYLSLEVMLKLNGWK